MIEPIRQEAISNTAGPHVLQVRRFTRHPRPKDQTHVNRLSKLAGKVFIFPLLGKWWIHQRDLYSPSSPPRFVSLVVRGLIGSGRTVHSEEAVLCSTFVRTVGVILHASAPSALDLREMTREYWDLLLSMRNSSSDPAVLESVLFGLLVILEITEARTAAEHFPKHVVETQAWTAGRPPCLVFRVVLI
jgi:telomere length regulation protein